MPKVVSRRLNYSSGPTKMSGEFVVDESKSGPRPGVLVVHEAFGLGEHAIDRAERLAGLGYAALAIDLWGERAQITDMPKVMDAIGAMTSDRRSWMGRVEAARQAMVAQPEVNAGKIAIIGYCFGGATALEYARTGGEIKGAASFHGALSPLGVDWASAKTKAKLLICTGAEDPLVPASAVTVFQENISGSGVDWEMNIYSGTKHSFTNPSADSAGMPEALGYNKRSDRRSWERLSAFLTEIFA